MKTLKILISMVLLFMIAPTMAQDRSIDSYSYKANPRCEFKIVVRAGKTDSSITYRLTFNGAALPTEGTLDADGIAELLLPISRQWYVLFIERDEADKELYTIKTSQGCDGSFARGVLAPAPILTENKWAAVQEKLKKFTQLIWAD